MRLGSCCAVVLAALCLTGQSVTRSGIHPEDMDPSCKPCTDFWRYVNGAWLDKNPIPGRASSWGTFSVLTEANQERTRTILEAAAADNSAAAGSNRRKMGDLYASCMDTATIDARGVSPLQPDFDRIAAIQSLQDLNSLLIVFQPAGGPFPFRLTSGQDQKNPSRVIARITTATLSLPDREYYFKTDTKSRETRDAFLQHAAKLLELSGSPRETAERQSREVLAFETKIAESLMTIAERRDPDKTYHLMTLAEVGTLAPAFNWAGLFRALGLPESTPINVSEPEVLKKFNTLLSSESLDTWKTWLHWRAIKLKAAYLAKPIADEEFHFERTVLAGVQEQDPRWRTCARIVDRDLGDVLGEAYVAKYFPPEAKRRMGELVENLRAAMRDELEHSDWMQPETKKNAIQKLNALRVQIGYPDKWHDYLSLEIKRAAFFENVRAAGIEDQAYAISKIGKPVNRNDWTMTPPTVNAYSNSGQVVVVFPAGILQPPFFDMQADDAANYGAIGAVIGHEIGHQFDDGGSKYDSTGALKNWWTEEDRKKFDARTSCVVDQFNTLDVGEGLHHTGKQVLGEALGDLGGVTVAYRAYQRSLNGKAGPALDGFTADQRFFISFARVWGTQYRAEAMRLQLNTNNHPISQYRAIATLQNIPEFHRAFQCKAGDPMVRPPAQQCKLW
jgi:endothelin-converting enzyme/putative endopeptidase